MKGLALFVLGASPIFPPRHFEKQNGPGHQLAIVCNSGTSQLSDVATFAPHAVIQVIKTIDIQGPGTNDGAFLTSFEQRFSQVPEPGSLTLAAVLCVCGVATMRRRRR